MSDGCMGLCLPKRGGFTLPLSVALAGAVYRAFFLREADRARQMPPSRIMRAPAKRIGSPVLLGLATTVVPPLPSAVAVAAAVPLAVPAVVPDVDFPDSDVVESSESLRPDV